VLPCAAVEAIRRFIGIRALWPLWATLAAVLIILPGLGSFGFWEPHEIAVADAAKKRLERYSLAEITGAVAGHYKLRGPDLASATAPAAPNLGRARALGVYLARRHTREPDFEIAHAYAMGDGDALQAADDEIRAGLDGDPALLAEHEAIITRLEGVRDKRLATDRQTRPDLTERAVALGISWRQDEWGARLPLALLGLLALMATWYLGFRLGGARAGLLASLILLTFPLFLLQSRQLTSDIGAITGSTMLMAGLAGLAWPADGRARHRLWFYGIDAALVAAGSLLAFEATGALLGLVPAVAATALACWIALLADGGAAAFPPPLAPDGGPPAGERNWRLIHLLAGACVTVLATGALLAWVLAETFDLTEPKPGIGELFGQGIAPSTSYVAALGGVWKSSGDLNQTFDSLFDQIAFGSFPWIALAPVALAHLAMGGRRGRRAWAGYLMFGWAAIAWAIAAVMQRKVGPVHYPALAALATGIALWLDDLIEARRWTEAEEGDRDTVLERARARFSLSPALPLAALFTLAAAMVIGKDLRSFAEELCSVHVLGAAVAYPRSLDLKAMLPALAFAFAVPLALALWLWVPQRPRIDKLWRAYPLPGLLLAAYLLLIVAIGWQAKLAIALGGLALVAAPVSLLLLRGSQRADLFAALAHRLGRIGLPWATVVSLVCAGFLAHVWTPQLSTKLSSRKLFAAYHRYRQAGDRLGVMGASGSGPKYYAGGTFARIDNRSALLSFLSDPSRSFALMPASELCPVHRAAKGKFDYVVLDDSNAQFLLVVNQQLDGVTDRNPLARTIRRTPPDGLTAQVIANYDNKIELIGVDMPRSVARGSSFQMTLYYRVRASVGGEWKVFAHFDSGMKFQGDHSLVDTVRCGTTHSLRLVTQ